MIRVRGGDSTCIGGGGGDTDHLTASGLVDRLLDLEDREGVRGSEEKRLRFVSALNALGAREGLGLSSSEP